MAPGFCLPGPQIDVKYAVSLYGIREDSYQDENGATGTAGLTFTGYRKIPTGILIRAIHQPV